MLKETDEWSSDSLAFKNNGSIRTYKHYGIHCSSYNCLFQENLLSCVGFVAESCKTTVKATALWQEHSFCNDLRGTHRCMGPGKFIKTTVYGKMLLATQAYSSKRTIMAQKPMN